MPPATGIRLGRHFTRNLCLDTPLTHITVDVSENVLYAIGHEPQTLSDETSFGQLNQFTDENNNDETKKNILTVSLFLYYFKLHRFRLFIFQPDYDMQAMNALPTTIRFERDTLQLGTIRYGEKRKVTFRFTNTGQTPSCSATSVHHADVPGPNGKTSGCPKGETGEIKITFDPNSLGHFLKNIDIVCNIDSGIMKLKLCGNVIE